MDGRADQYSLGCVLYECLTGRVPFTKERDAAIIWAHVEEMPAMPSTVRAELPPEVDDVFSRVLAKKPDDRYSSCREFIDQARVSLGSVAAGPVRSHTVSMVRPPLGSTSPSDVAGQRAPAGQPATAAGGPGHGERAPDPQDSRRPRRRRRWPWVAALAALVLIVAGVGAFVATRGNSASKGHGMAMPPAHAAHVMPGALDKALTAANGDMTSMGFLPPRACRQQSATMVTCTNPYDGIFTATFRIYPSLKALYSAYEARVQSGMPGPFRSNYGNCGVTEPAGELSWAHDYFHSTAYSIQQMISGTLDTEKQAAGRVFCSLSNNDTENVVWTLDPGLLLAWATGSPHTQVLGWWSALHHNIYLGGPRMNM